MAKARFKPIPKSPLGITVGGRPVFFEPRPEEEWQRQPPKSGARTPAANKSGGRKIRTVRGLLPKLYPPDGKVSDSVSTKTVRQKVIVVLGYDVSWDTVNRALGRSR
jgi:hypothetical protein